MHVMIDRQAPNKIPRVKYLNLKVTPRFGLTEDLIMQSLDHAPVQPGLEIRRTACPEHTRLVDGRVTLTN